MVRLGLLVAAALALAWFLAVAVMDGVVIRTPLMRLSARDPLRPFLIALTLGSMYAIRYRDRWRDDLHSLFQVPSAGAAAAVAATAAVACGMLMALFQWLGGPQAVFLVVPLCGGPAVWSTYVLGRRLAGGWAGAAAAMWLLSSAPFL